MPDTTHERIGGNPEGRSMIRRPLEPGFSRDGFYRLQVLPRKLGQRQDRAFGPLYSATGHAQSWR